MISVDRLTKTSPMGFCYQLMRLYPLRIFFIFFATCIFHISDFMFSYVIKKIVDTLTFLSENKNLNYWDSLLPYVYLLGGLFTIGNLGSRTQHFLHFRTIPLIKKAIQEVTFNHLQKQSYRFFQDNLSGNLAGQVIALANAFESIMRSLRLVTIPTLFLISLSLVIFTSKYHYIGLCVFVWISVLLTLNYFSYKRLVHLGGDYIYKQSILSGFLVDSFQNIFSIKSFVQEKYEAKQLNRTQQPYIEAEQNLERFILVVDLIRSTSTYLFMIGIVLAMLSGYRKGLISAGDITFVVMNTFNLVKMMWWFSADIIETFKNLGTIKKGQQLLSTPFEIKDPSPSQTIKISEGTVEFHNITFGYNDSKNLFKDLNLIIPNKQKIGLVGYSGSGKTSFINLIQRFFDVQEGSIIIDGQNIKDFTQESLRKQITVIPQEPLLFHRSIYENLICAAPDLNRDQIIDACQKAHCHDFIQQLAKGYDTIIGERGIKLSLGQRQRLIIARAILKNSPILILDEATSALDSATEKSIQESLAYLMKDRTTIIIAHRLSTLMAVDRILVFDNGQIVEDGTHASLIRKRKLYHHLWSLQVGGFIHDQGEEV